MNKLYICIYYEYISTVVPYSKQNSDSDTNIDDFKDKRKTQKEIYGYEKVGGPLYNLNLIVSLQCSRKIDR